MKKIFALPASAKSVFSLTKTGFLILFLTQLSFAQIVIEERVEVDPDKPEIILGKYITNCLYDTVSGPGGWLGSEWNTVFFGGDEYAFCLGQTTHRSINVFEGSEFVRLWATEYNGSCIEAENYQLVGDQVNLQVNSCYYATFDETFPSDSTVIKIRTIDWFDNVQIFKIILLPNKFILFDESPKKNLDKNQEFSLFICAYPEYWFGNDLPDTTTYNIEIISGAELGNLLNTITSETGTIFSDLPHNYGCLDHIVLQTNELVNTNDSIKIKVSTSDPNIDPIDIKFEKSFIITIVPNNLSPGDTAQIIPKMKNSDGTFTDFPSYQGFEIGMIDGCDAGMLLSDGILEPYFEEVYQPIYFVADSNVTESTTVAIRVGLIEYFGGKPIFNGGDPDDTDIELKTRLNDKRNMANDKLSNNIKEPEPLPMNPTNYCFIGEIYWNYRDDGNLVVDAGDGCSPLCTGELPFTNILTTRL